jgi:hypothetical protein
MLDFHLEINGKNVRVALLGLPAAEAKLTVQHATGAGEVRSRKMITGIRKSAKVDFATLRDGDPEIDLLMAGNDADDLTPAYFDPDSAQPKPINDFQSIDVIFGADGVEKSRRPHLVRKPNINDTFPVKVSKRIKVTELFNSYVPKHMLQVVHTDGLNFDFLRSFSKELYDSEEAAVVRAGAKANAAIVLRNHSNAYNGFLVAGEVTDSSYQLLLVLSDQELKHPEVATKPEGASA